MNVASERSLRRAEARRKADASTNETVIQTLMRSVDGRRWIWLRLEEAQIFVETEGLDPLRMAYERGIRNSGLRLLRDVTRTCPNEYITMTRENTGVDLNQQESEDE